MGAAWRTTPMLVVGLALIGCDKEPPELGPSPSSAKVARPRTAASANLPTVTLKIPGMS
jgi:hypothetical protein